MSQTKQEASRSPSTRAILHFARGFGQHSYLFPHLIIQGCAPTLTVGHRNSGHRTGPGHAMQSSAGLSGGEPAEHPTAARGAFRQAP